MCSELLLPARKHRLQISVVSLWFRAADEADLLRFARRRDADALRTHSRFFFAVIIIEHRILIAIDREVYRCHIELRPKVVSVVKLLLRSFSIFGKFKLDLSRQAKAVLQVTAFAGQVFRGANGDDPGWLLYRTTEDHALVLRAKRDRLLRLWRRAFIYGNRGTGNHVGYGNRNTKHNQG